MKQEAIQKLTEKYLKYDEFVKIIKEYNLKTVEIANLIDKLNSKFKCLLAYYLMSYDDNIINYLLEKKPEFSAHYVFRRYVNIRKLWDCIWESNFSNLTELELAITIVLLYSKHQFTKINFIIETHKDKLETIMYFLGDIYVDFAFDIMKYTFYYLIENVNESEKFNCMFSFIHGVAMGTAESCAC